MTDTYIIAGTFAFMWIVQCYLTDRWKKTANNALEVARTAADALKELWERYEPLRKQREGTRFVGMGKDGAMLTIGWDGRVRPQGTHPYQNNHSLPAEHDMAGCITIPRSQVVGDPKPGSLIVSTGSAGAPQYRSASSGSVFSTGSGGV